MRLIFKLTKSAEVGTNTAAEKNKVNTIVTTSHIVVTLAFSVSQTIRFLNKSALSEARMTTAFFFIGGMADLFLSVMMWFIFDNDNAPTVFVDGERVYVVSDVIKSS